MKFRMFSITLALAATLPLLASSTLFSGYESVRQGLLKGSLQDVQKSATQLASDATKAKNQTVATQAKAVASAADLNKARAAFAPLSDEMIKLRAAAKGDRPAVYYCSMLKKSWLQQKGKVGNPYDASMPMCGELKEE